MFQSAQAYGRPAGRPFLPLWQRIYSPAPDAPLARCTTRINGVWRTRILPRDQAKARFAADQVKAVDRVAISAVDRYGNQSAPALLDVRRLLQTSEPITAK